ncbi:MAG: ABC-type nitrate/sulfonate/bicarbonate transport system, permease component [Chlamydiales bacterium]|jgi:NitT/TauT family transport system permease protein|nr:ABC-type nitrate/sulfonate/bicarbonate transport system, permease component [Chlamydiales bacterium]
MKVPTRITAWRVALAAVVITIIWSLVSWLMHSSIVPVPEKVFIQFFDDLGLKLGQHVAISLYRVLSGVIIGSIIAIPLGMVLGREPAIDKYIAPFIYLIYPIPKIVFLPLFLVLLGIGDFSKILLIAVIIFFQIIVTTRNAAIRIDPKLIDSIVSLGGERKHLYRHVVWPACFPEIINNLRVSIGTAIAVLFMAETYATQQGIGFFIFEAMSCFDYCSVYSGVIAISLMGLSFFLLLDWIEYLFIPWKRERRA